MKRGEKKTERNWNETIPLFNLSGTQTSAEHSIYRERNIQIIRKIPSHEQWRKLSRDKQQPYWEKEKKPTRAFLR